MRITKLLSIGLLATFGLSAIAQTAMAGINVGKDNSKSPSPVINLNATGLTPYTTYQVEFDGSMRESSKKANECGFVKWSATSTSFPIASGNTLFFGGSGTGVLVSSLPVEAAPKCSNGQLSGTNLTPSANLRTAEGDIYVTGLTPFTSYAINNQNLKYSPKAKANGCGILKLGNHLSGQVLRIKLNGTDVHTVSAPESVPGFAVAPSCKDNTLLLPPGFPNL